MPISNDGILKSANYIISKLGCVESPIVVSFVIVSVICLILLYAFGDKIKELDKKLMYKVYVSISIIVVVAIFIHDTVLLKSMDKAVVVPYANTNQINPNTISGGVAPRLDTLRPEAPRYTGPGVQGPHSVVSYSEFTPLTNAAYEHNYGT